MNGSSSRGTDVAVLASTPLTVFGISALLSARSHLTVVACAPTAEELFAQIARSAPHAVIVETSSVPDAARLRSLIDELRHRAGNIVVVALAEHPRQVITVLRAGARGFVLKDSPSDEIVRSVGQAVGGSVPVSPRALPYLVSEIVSPTPAPRLSLRESEVLHLVAQGLSNRRIAEKLHLSEATVKTHMRRIFHKLEVGDRASAVARAMSRDLLGSLEERPATRSGASEAAEAPEAPQGPGNRPGFEPEGAL
ncbi:hypothetical protein A6A06_19285 [Streptomyces sp. CB02923]|uniref:LuxR C-terminal-related transcriptional regulator n=1 Tax=Streptomyces sp. CB02923 TaxID=1718985 RepID=UPI00093B49D4|nr:response regulator transcription factor [Streptomyces sp. CB02923]OKI01012.1 hypothetical protein A6A06_19285 [Streptomyces sp. CB02923]